MMRLLRGIICAAHIDKDLELPVTEEWRARASRGSIAAASCPFTVQEASLGHVHCHYDTE